MEMRGVTKRFPGVIANRDVDLVVEEGEILALIGENGAGKSTLMNVLYGLYDADEGEVLLDDQPRTFNGPGDAIAAGIGMVHQHFMLVPVFTVAENIVLGVEPTRGAGRLAVRRAEESVRELSDRHNLPVDPHAVIEDLPVGLQQRVEILKALYRDAELLIMDEPTAVLTPQETEELFTAMRALKDQGTSIIFITHKLGEALEVADRISVLRGGEIAGHTTPAETDQDQLAAMMVGREVDLVVDREPATPGEVVLAIRGLEVVNDRGQLAVKGVDLDLRAGEIVAIAGVQGNGQSEFVEALNGVAEVTGGSIELDGRELVGLHPKEILRAGVGQVQEDRYAEAMVAEFSVAENLVLNTWDAEPYARRGVLQSRTIDELARKEVEEFDIRTPSIHTDMGNLSGGNQQKVVVAREFARDLRVLVAAGPTRGIDVGSIEYIHERIVAFRDAGHAVLVVSTELDEVMALGDRVAVMHGGTLSGPYDAPVDRDAIGLLMAGIDPDRPVTASGSAEQPPQT
ncbi:ABC transporter ATP-binding protein [Nitriliruptoria bacterium AS10]|nr:ABC transporter ATP-binding protein [Salsipaludibacter albus]MBY5161628.1 ABC transporter ATP-binding protein [Salsipaludibacter albus]